MMKGFKKYRLKVKITKPFGNLLRKKHVLVVLKNENGQYVLGSKKIYPIGIFRFVGGGHEGTEKLIETAKREVFEEIGLKLKKSQLIALAEIEILASDLYKKTHRCLTYLFFAEIKNELLVAGGDLDKIKKLRKLDLERLIERYDRIDSSLWFRSDQGFEFAWRDYGKVYGPIHQIGIKRIAELSWSS